MLAKGGGKMERVQEFYFYPTLIIGLGGTGQKVVRRVKRRLREAYGDVPIIRYLVVDTDSTANQPGEEPLEDYERVEIRGFDLNQVVENLEMYPSIREWWPSPDLKPGFIRGGSPQQMRCAGRLALFSKYSDFIQKLREATGALAEIENADSTERMSTPQRRYIVERGAEGVPLMAKVFIILSLCGGTGSGILLDVVYLCRYLLRGLHPIINVMAVLPTVLDTVPTIKRTSIIRDKNRANTYACLKELDHFISNPRWVCLYPDGVRVEVSSPPFDFMYMVDLRNQRGERLNSIDDICEMIASAIFLSTGLPTAREMERQDTISHTTLARIQGKFRAFSSVAATSLIFPKERILDYCSARMAEALIKDGFLQGGEGSTVKIKGSDVEQAVSAFLGEAHLRDEEVVAELRRERRVVITRKSEILRSQDVATALRLLTDQEGDNRTQRQEQANLIKEKVASLLEVAKEALERRVLDEVKGRGLQFATLFLETLTREPQPGEVDRTTTSLLGLRRRIELKGVPERALEEAERSYARAKSQLRAFEGNIFWKGMRFIPFFFRSLWQRTLKERISSCLTYMEEANEMALDIEAQRRASDLYNALVAEAKRLLLSLAQVRQKLVVAAEKLSAEAEDKLKPPSALEGVYELVTEVVDADYIKRYYEERAVSIDFPTAFREFARSLPDMRVAQLEMRSDKDYINRLKEYAAGYFREGLEKIHVLDILSERAPEEIEGQFQKLTSHCEPFCRYDRAGLGEEPEPIFVSIIGVEDKGDLRIPERYRNEAISTGLRHRIDAFKAFHGIPAFLISDMGEYKSCYERARSGIDPLHIGKGWEKFEDLFPELKREARDTFALALAFDFIVQIGEWYYFDPERKYKERGVRPPQENRLAQGREKAEEAFIERDEMVKRAMELIEEEIARKGNEATVNFLRQKVEECEGKIRDYPTSALREFWEKEVEVFRRKIRALQG
jgi:hypothetical protein